MTKGKTIKPLKPKRRAGGTYGQADISPAAEISKVETTRAGEPTFTTAEPPSPPKSEKS
jgi:hypothetical protein